MADKRMTEDEAAATLSDGMTIGIGGWGFTPQAHVVGACTPTH